MQQTIVLQHHSALAQCHNLSVRRRIVTANRPVPAFADDAIILH